MDISNQNITAIILILLTGLSAGLCFTWSNAITPGIGRLNDYGYLSAFQEINRSIINLLFVIVFFGPFFLGIVNIYVFKNEPSSIIWLLIISLAIYFSGVLMVTAFGNIPLNDLLDKADLSKASLQDLKLLRNQFETKWNRLHLIRTISSIISFLLLLLTLLIKK
jgi:uncharacterized membrane protein